jgi:integration host factor subunit alpha
MLQETAFMTLNKARLRDSIHSRVQLSKGQSAKLLDSLFEMLKITLENEEDILIRGFGKFYVRKNNNRRGRESLTAEVSPGLVRVVKFKCSPVLKAKINGQGDGEG